MGIEADEQREKSAKTKPPLLPKPCLSSSAGPGEHVIPQMVITAADDLPDESQNGAETTPVPISSSPEAASADIHVEEEAKDIEPPKEVVHQRPLTIGSPENESTDVLSSKSEGKSADSVCHSTAQRPLVFEPEKPVCHTGESTSEIDSLPPSPIPPPQPTAPTTMQRPLIFDGSVVQTEIAASPNAEPKTSESNYATKTKEWHADDAMAMQPDAFEPQPVLDSPTSAGKPKVINFPWTKETKLTNEDQASKAMHAVSQNLQDEKEPPKKDGLHNVKKFFDSFKHDKPVHTSENPLHEDTEKEVHKDLKHGIKHLFSSPKVDLDAEQKNVQNKEPKVINKDHKDIKHNVKHFFDSFKQDSTCQKTNEQGEINQVLIDDMHKSQSKESKHGLQKFLDSFKHENVDTDKRRSKSMEETCTEGKISEEKSIVDKFLGSFHQVKDKPKSDLLPNDELSNVKNLSKSIKQEPVSNKETVATSAPKHEQNEYDAKAPSKDASHGAKKFFDSFKHENEKSKIDSQTQVEENKKHKDSLHGVKKFFDSFKHEEHVVSSSELPKISEADDTRHKDNMSPVKKFFDSFKHEEHTANSELPKTPEADDTRHKDNVSPVKKFFDSFKHEEHTANSELPNTLEAGGKSHKEGMSPVKKFFDSFKHEEHAASHSELPKTSETEDTKHKGSMSPVKKFFSTFKHEEQAPSNSELSKTSGAGDKSQKDNQPVKKFVDSFKHEEHESKNIEFSAPINENDEKENEVESRYFDYYHNVQKEAEVKDSKESSKALGLKVDKPTVKFSDIPKQEQMIENINVPKIMVEPTKKQEYSLHGTNKFSDSFNPKGQLSTSADSTKTLEDSEKSNKEKHKVKNFFHSFKHEGQVSTSADPAKTFEDSEKAQKEKHKVKNFFDSFKHEGQVSTSADSVKTFEDSEKAHHKEKHKVKNFFDSFKHEGQASTSVDSTKTLEGSEKAHKEKHKVKKFFDSFKHETPECTNLKESEESKNSGLKRSQSFKESAADKEPLRSVKSFFDFSHKGIPKVSSQPHVSFDIDNEHIYDFVDTSGKQSPLSLESTSKKSEEKAKDGHQSVKKLFDSFRHKDSSKPKVEKNIERTNKTDTKVPVQDSKDLAATISREIPSTMQIQPAQKTVQAIKQIDVSKSSKRVAVDSSSPSVDHHSMPTNHVPEIQIDEPSISAETKTSVFSTIGENILAMKDKVMHPKETKRKEPAAKTDESKIQEYDLQSPKKSSDISEIQGTYKPLSHSTHSDNNYANDREFLKKMETVQSKPSTSQTSAQAVSLVGPKPIKKAALETSTPETLYDTCCLRIAVLLKDKALEIVSDQTKKPPQKPPKPSAEAIAKARAASVSRKLQELQGKDHHSIGDNIPIGFDGIRFADDETESSCDYKDVENFDYIMDYELINRYKFENKFDTFSVPSTCSGMTSYYTADTVTLRDENFSDALETTSLKDGEFYLKDISSVNINEAKSVPILNSGSKTKESKKQPLIKIFSNLRDDFMKKKVVPETKPRAASTGQSTVKKIPPPLPPKPVLHNLKHKPTIDMHDFHQEDKNVSQCINGLSLSPRLQNKFSKDTAAVQKRPLMVADVKETNFMSLRQVKSKDSQGKSLKDRKFDTVLRNESLKNISAIHKPLTATKSSPDVSNSHSLNRKLSPQRPPPPIISIRSEDSKQTTKTTNLSLVQKQRCDGISTTPRSAKEKRTISPPRPPPPTFSNKNKCPPRPPPPIPAEKELSEKRPEQNSGFVEPNIEASLKQEFSTDALTDSFQLPSTVDTSIPTSSQELPSEIHDDTSGVALEYNEVNSPYYNEVTSMEHWKGVTSPVAVNHSQASEKTCKSVSKDDLANKTPKPPPRIRRVRSRTVEVVPVEKMSDSRLRRSQSLSDVEVEKKVSFLNADKGLPSSSELKSLYTKVNKDIKKVTDMSRNSEQNLSNPEKVSTRPLPAPPPPPRKFRSLDRKPKVKAKESESTRNANQIELESDDKSNLNLEIAKSNNAVDQDKDIFEDKDDYAKPDQQFEETTQVLDSSSLKPPRRKRNDKQRFLSLHGDEHVQKISSFTQDLDSKLQRSSSVPLKPDRRLKNTRYDENANVAFPVMAEVHRCPKLDECGNIVLDSSSIPTVPNFDTTDSRKISEQIITPLPHQRKKKPRKKSHSSWYDEEPPVEESWEVMDWNANDEAEIKDYSSSDPFRRKSDPGKKSSKFYVDVEQSTDNFPLVDKETSPLPLDCSEKSVQTSLETLSQGIPSRDEDSEDTDELLNLAQNLQDELKIIINRHKSVSEELDEDSNTPPLSAADSEKNFAQDLEIKSREKKTPSVRSSASDLWPLTSSEESDGEVVQEGLSETAMNRKQKKIFYIAQEIMTSEEVFVDALKLLNEDFKAAVDTASKQKNSAIIPDDVLSQILNHLPQLQHLNENLLMELKDRVENWDKTGKIADIIVKMGPFLKLYSWYIHDFETNLSLLEDSKKKYPMFNQVVKEFEMSARCKRLALNHFMLKPIQRIPQYRLLLQEYLHHLPEESPDYQDTVTALQIVSEVANHANESMKQGDNAQKLISIQNSIMGHKEIIKPGRVFVKEGELMKLSRKGMQPRWFVLFNDLLLYLTPVQQGLYRVNHELPLTGMKVAIPIQQDYQNEFSIISVTRSFTLAAKSPEERQEWIIALTKAIEENASKRSTFTNIRLQQKAQDKASEEDESSFILGRKAPVWVPDARVTMCQLCTSEFTVTFRRHHCRACGKVVCSICSSNRISLPYLGNRIARVCDECHTKIGPGSSACTESGETDSDNQQIAVKSHLRSEHRHVKKNRRNLPSVLKEVCANDQGSTLSGYLQKKSGKNWKREWFVIKDKVLYEYKASEDVAALRSIPLLGYQIESFSEYYENVEPSLLFQLTHPGQAPIIFHADTVCSTERWVAALKEATVL